LVRRVSGCSKLPETVISRPSTCILPTILRPAFVSGSPPT
jgi:hypothetical protein